MMAYLMEFLLFSLLFDAFVLSQKLLIIVIIIVLRFWMHPRLLLLLLVVGFNEWLWIRIFRKRIICQIHQLSIGFIRPLNLLLHVWLVIAYYINIIVVNWAFVIVSDLFFLDNLYLSILLSSRLCLSLHELCLKILLFELFNGSLTYFSLF